MLRFGVNNLVVKVFIHSLFLILTVIWGSVHLTIHEEVRFLLIDAWLVPVSGRATAVLWVVDDGFISVLQRGRLSSSSFLAGRATSWSYVLLFIIIVIPVPVFVGILTKVVIFIVINQGWGLSPRILMLRVSLWLIGLKTSAWSTCSLSASTSRRHPIWRLQLPAVSFIIRISILSMPARNVLCLAQLPISFIKIILLIIIWREVVTINIKINRLIVLQMLLLLIGSCYSTLPALSSRSTKRDLRWHHPVLNHTAWLLIILSSLSVLIIRSIILNSASRLWPSTCSISRGIWVRSVAVPDVVLHIISIVLTWPHKVFVIKSKLGLKTPFYKI